ncbi:uncharacterized protein LOC131804164 [Musca domestica]|uniref:Uncharacterized protein LOC131804164 n=1 Tax=Musca domestica TaxID=7370 RepID=A0ABM3V9Z9_MUSDO|nr:uncharacterized protein LOC131804164 [Musca domestica]
MPLTKGFLNPIEKRVVAIVEWEYMMGNVECPDSLEIEVENNLNALINEDTSQHDINTYKVEVLEDEIDALQNHTSLKHSTQEIDKSSYNKHLKKDSNNKEEFLKIAKTQAEALLVMLSVAFLKYVNFL